jgi:GNAT superfamily N-acetyltransferase
MSGAPSLRNRSIYVKQVCRIFSDLGVLGGSARTLHHVMRPAYWNTRYRIYGVDVGATPSAGNADGRFRFRLLDPTDQQALRQVEAMAAWLAGHVRRRLTDGGVCLAALDGERVVAFNLIGFGQVDIPAVRLRWTFGPTEAWSEQITTHKAFRNFGLAKLVRRHAFAELRRRGVQWFYGGTLPNNSAALALARSVGFTELGDLCYRRIVGRQRWTYQRITNERSGRVPSPFDGIDQLPTDQLST